MSMLSPTSEEVNTRFTPEELSEARVRMLTAILRERWKAQEAQSVQGTPLRVIQGGRSA